MNVFRRSLLFIFLTLVTAQTEAQTTSRSLVGNWSGTYEGDTIEIAVWFDRKPTELPLVRGFIINQAQNCGAGLAGERSSGRAVERSRSIVTTFFGWVRI